MALIFNLSNPTRTVLHAKSWLEVEKYYEPQTFFSLDWIELMAQWLRWGAVMMGSFPAGCWNILPTLFYDSSELIWTLIAKTDLHQHLSRHQNSLAIPANASQPQTAEHSNQKAYYPITGPLATTYNGSKKVINAFRTSQDRKVETRKTLGGPGGGGWRNVRAHIHTVLQYLISH